MKADIAKIKLGLTEAFTCGYLPTEQEQLLVAVDQQAYTPDSYEQLLALGFRRSGARIYRPHCPHCQQCQSLRIDPLNFVPSRSQKRILKRNLDITWKLTVQQGADFYPLYEKYINERHQDGDMYPASVSQYENFVLCDWMTVSFLCGYKAGQLVCVMVLDTMPNAFSALYTFFDPELSALSLGSLAILQALQMAKEKGKQFVYLGYQIDACDKMAYKKNYKPHQRLTHGIWKPQL